VRVCCTVVQSIPGCTRVYSEDTESVVTDEQLSGIKIKIQYSSTSKDVRRYNCVHIPKRLLSAVLEYTQCDVIGPLNKNLVETYYRGGVAVLQLCQLGMYDTAVVSTAVLNR
jgi:hypothetical protein